MEKKKLKQNKKKTKKHGFLGNCFACISQINEDEEDPCKSSNNIALEPTSSVMAAKHEVSVTYQATSSFFMTKPEVPLENMSPNNALLSQAYSEKVQNYSNEKRPTPPNEPDSKKSIDKEQKDQVVKTILTKYLAMKREGLLNKKSEVQGVDQSKFPQAQESDFLNVEFFSSDSSETVVLESTSHQEPLRPKAEFPTKSKSAPTTSTAHDSLADICSKMSRYKQENQSDSYVTCSSEENTTCKKKLELIFNQSSEEMFSCLEDNTSSLQYEINCEKMPIMIGTLRASESLHSKKYTKFTSHVLHMQPSAKGEIDGLKGSASSLKWKLIISHHARGDFPLNEST